MVRTVIFDIDGTMYDYDLCHGIAMKALETYARETLGVEAERFGKAFAQATRETGARIGYSCAAIHNRLIRYQCVLELLRRPVFPHARTMCHIYWETMLEQMRPFPGLIQWLEQLKQQGIRIGVGTNMTAYVQYLKLERLGAAPFVDWIVTSEEAGVEKPHERFFELCIEKSGGKPEECLFVGDGITTDAAGSMACGMNAMLFAPKGYKKEQFADCCRIASYEECLAAGFLESVNGTGK